jgi:hypothetical protein
MAVCMFVYGTNLSSFIVFHIYICAVKRNNLYVVAASVSSLFFKFKGIDIQKKISLKKMSQRENGNACWEQMDKWDWTKRSISDAVTVARHDRSFFFRYWSCMTSPWHHHYHYHHCYHYQHGISRTWNKGDQMNRWLKFCWDIFTNKFDGEIYFEDVHKSHRNTLIYSFSQKENNM